MEFDEELESSLLSLQLDHCFPLVLSHFLHQVKSMNRHMAEINQPVLFNKLIIIGKWVYKYRLTSCDLVQSHWYIYWILYISILQNPTKQNLHHYKVTYITLMTGWIHRFMFSSHMNSNISLKEMKILLIRQLGAILLCSSGDVLWLRWGARTHTDSTLFGQQL